MVPPVWNHLSSYADLPEYDAIISDCHVLVGYIFTRINYLPCEA